MDYLGHMCVFGYIYNSLERNYNVRLMNGGMIFRMVNEW
jgi:hypothetical protein